MYEKPLVLGSDELAEGVFTASGTTCYTASGYIHQTPENGRGDYRIQLNAVHIADQTDQHHSTGQQIVVTFNLPVSYQSSQGTLAGGDNTNELKINYSYHSNAHDNIGLGDLVVTADAGLAVESVVCYDTNPHATHDGCQ